MKGIIRKTGEEITIVSYGGGIDRSDVLDYVSYIDSHGVEHPREKLNPYWDVEFLKENQSLIERQQNILNVAARNIEKQSSNTLSKKEYLALVIYTAILNGIFTKPGSNHWKPEEVADIVESHVSKFMRRFVKEEKK